MTESPRRDIGARWPALRAISRRVPRNFRAHYWDIAEALAQPYLGGVPHICTNEYTRRDGISLFTDHGPQHAAAVAQNVYDLRELVRGPSEYERFILFTATLIHDLGMFLRLVESDVVAQRRYHGRLAQIVLGNYAQDGAPRTTDMLDVWYIGTIARLHQTKEFTQFLKASAARLSSQYLPVPERRRPAFVGKAVTYDRILKLGAVLLLADGFDIRRGRADDRIDRAFAQILGPLNPTSDAEWLVNSLVHKYTIALGDSARNRIDVNYWIDPQEALRKLMLNLPLNSERSHRKAACYVLSLLWRYLHDSHFAVIKPLFSDWVLRITVRRLGTERILAEMKSTAAVAPYAGHWTFWYDGLQQLRFGRRLRTCLEKTLRAGGFDACFVMVHDQLRSVLRIVVPHDFDDVYRRRLLSGARVDLRSLRDACCQARVPSRFSVAGQVWYRGLPEFILHGNERAPRGARRASRSRRNIQRENRMMAESIDSVLGLRYLFYLPVTEQARDQRLLKFLLVFNYAGEDAPQCSRELERYCSSVWQEYAHGRLPLPTGADLPPTWDGLDDVIEAISERLSTCDPQVTGG